MVDLENVYVFPPTEEVAKLAKSHYGPSPSLQWPVHGRTISAFKGGRQIGRPNSGIDIAVPEGTDIRAAEEGVVSCAAGNVKTIGGLLVIWPTGGYFTVYARANELLVETQRQGPRRPGDREIRSNRRRDRTAIAFRKFGKSRKAR